MIALLFASVLLLAGFHQPFAGSMPAGPADDLIQPAVNWLLGKASVAGSSPPSIEAGWGADTARVLLALHAVGVDRWNPDGPDALVCRQQLDIQLLVFLLKNPGRASAPDVSEDDDATAAIADPPQQPQLARERANSLAQYALALAGSCRNPRDFYDQDVVAPILAAEDESREAKLQPFTFAFNTLAACASGAHLKRRHIVKLLEIVNHSPSDAHSIDVLAMVALATSCLTRSAPKYRHLQDYLDLPLRMIAAQQQTDGSFNHNVPTTALAVQALTIPDELKLEPNVTGGKAIPLPAWRPDLASDWLRSQQKPDGSFGDVFKTTEVLMALGPGRGYGSISYPRCLLKASQAPATPAAAAPTPMPTAKAADQSGDPSGLVHFTYVVWIGQNRSEVYAISLSVSSNFSFYEAMQVAAENDPRFEFSASVWPNGHYVHTINGHRDQYIGFHFWLLFRLTTMPDPENPPPATVPYVAPAGVDDLYPQTGDYFLFWYKDA